MKNRYPREEALLVALELKKIFDPYCERIVIAGSLRRETPTVADIEILYIPMMVNQQVDLLTTAEVPAIDKMIAFLEKDKYLERRLNSAGSTMFGEKNKLMRDVFSGIPVDLFSCSVDDWWVSLVIRTGSKETNLRLTTGANKRGLTLNAYGSGVTDRVTGIVTPATSERHVFDLCGVPYQEPEDR